MQPISHVATLNLTYLIPRKWSCGSDTCYCVQVCNKADQMANTAIMVSSNSFNRCCQLQQSLFYTSAGVLTQRICTAKQKGIDVTRWSVCILCLSVQLLFLVSNVQCKSNVSFNVGRYLLHIASQRRLYLSLTDAFKWTVLCFKIPFKRYSTLSLQCSLVGLGNDAHCQHRLFCPVGGQMTQTARSGLLNWEYMS